MRLEQARDELVELLVRGHKRTAVREAVRLVEEGFSLADVVLGVLAPAQVEVGRRWQDRTGTVEQEQLATEVADTVLTMVAGRITPGEPRGRLVLCVAEREHHNLPTRMVAELLRAEGYEVLFLGNPQSPQGLAGIVGSYGAQAVLVSCSLPMNLPGAIPIADAGHQAGVPVIAGGRAFDGAGRAARVGADAYALTIPGVPDAVEAARAAPLASSVRGTDHEAACSELGAIRELLAAEFADALVRTRLQTLPQDLRELRPLRAEVRIFLRFLEAAVLCDPAIIGAYTSWLSSRAFSGGGQPRWVRSLVSLAEHRLTIDNPLTADPLEAARGAALVLA